jgi:hypothetical protein
MELQAQPLRPVKRKPGVEVGANGVAFQSFARREGVTVPLTVRDHFAIVPSMTSNDGSAAAAASSANSEAKLPSRSTQQPRQLARTSERVESLHMFRQKRRAVWPIWDEPYASAQVRC